MSLGLALFIIRCRRSGARWLAHSFIRHPCCRDFEGMEHLHVSACSLIIFSPLQTAITGTERVLRYALDAGVKKVVVTSSVSALSRDETMWENVTIGEDGMSSFRYGRTSTHSSFNGRLESPDLRGSIGSSRYTIRRILRFEEARGTSSMEVCERKSGDQCRFGRVISQYKIPPTHMTIMIAYPVLPTAIYGPGGRGQVLTTPAGGTNAFIYTLIQGPRGRPLHDQKPYITSFAHVNDVARAHILALNVAPSAKPNRIIISAGKFTWKEAVDYLAKKRPELKDRLPVVTGTEKVYDTVTYDSSSAAKLIGLTEYISWEETLESTIDDILRREAELGIDTTASS